ncbi:MAG: hypothetical protein Q8J97_07770, partial [Flavobacteriaceae bacterium]|nr:hypothetical protein [Flavobacteriaceae bacterium]
MSYKYAWKGAERKAASMVRRERNRLRWGGEKVRVKRDKKRIVIVIILGALWVVGGASLEASA